MTVGKATDPTSDPNWLTTGFNTDLMWDISTAGSTSVTYIAEADSNFNSPGTFSGVIDADVSNTLTKGCDSSSGVNVSYDLTTNQYGVSFPPSCIGSPHH